MIRNEKTEGFTLIELLVVISIISLLAVIALVALTGTRADARDAKRRADIVTMQSALALYYSENNDYPGNVDPVMCQVVKPGLPPVYACFATFASGADPWWIPGLEGYMSPPPQDPGGHTYDWEDDYLYLKDFGENGGAGPIFHDYVLMYRLENTTEDQQEDDCNIGYVILVGVDDGTQHKWTTRCPD
ncbi:prepilin-type N-terminal cleavage/methylation domain-containing protein [Patescibacteria group bacterium]|nr:prepilin-type N-terminal cleavage/methylation domain-containing protein [Patescibacteria group bacterium]MBU1890936.1 prepilin-type N-terminal cleavage/methylation domain-containing protein [Patescibacteria group bacterium]